MTNKQKAVAKDLLENVGKPVGQAMLDAGYSPATAKNPDHLTESKGWQELMDQYLPDLDVLEAHKQGLKATKIFSSHTEPDKEVPDHPTRLKAVELAYRVKKKLNPSDVPNLGTGNNIMFVSFKNESES